MEGNEYLTWDINYQNVNGDTAFHVAISTDADINILKALLEKDADVNVTNNNGKTPFECINHGSWQTAINLLKLEKVFDLRDDIGDTFLHVLMDRVGDSVWGIRRTIDGKCEFGNSDQEQMIEKFWDYILENVDEFAIDLNAQNKYGCTTLHIAADYWPSMKSLEMMLSYFKHVDPFICDEDGENFLHKYFLKHKRMYAQQFQGKMLKGELKYLPKEALVKLLNSQNINKNTPLHILIKLGHGKSVCDYEDILEAGTDPNISDWKGDTALHCIFKKYVNQLEEDSEEPDEESKLLDDLTDKVIQCLVKHGADVNAINQRGESPIFLANNKEHINTLVNLGADINQRNELLQTPLLYFVGKKNVELGTLEDLLRKGANVSAADINGSTVLHYIAWHGFHRDFLPALNKYKMKDIRDKLGQLPCDVAYMQGYKAVFDELCQCSNDSHMNQEHLNLTSDVIKLSTLVKTPEEFEEKFDRIRNFRGDKMSKVLSLPGIGAVNFEGEIDDIKNVTKDIIESICAKLTEKNEFWKCRIMQSGSVGEDTKVQSPNEFDFVIIVEKLGEICFVDEQQSHQDQGYAYLKLKQEYVTEEYKRFFNDDNYLDTDEVRRELDEILQELYTTESPFKHPNISFVVGNNKAIISPTFNFTFYWKGCLYKNLLVDIDLVPACQIKNWWPDNCNIDDLQGDSTTLQEQGAILLLQSEIKDDVDAQYISVPQCKLRVSAMSAEKEHMLNLPQVARDAYKVCKILCDSRICPDLHVKEDIPIKKLLTSYMLKNTMFHVMNDIKVSEQRRKSEPTEKNVSNFGENTELQTIVRNIFVKLLKFTRDENLPSFVFPWQNVFTFNSKVLPHHNHYFCAFRYCFIKVMLSMLGERQYFSDIDEVSCSRAVRDRNEFEEAREDSHEEENEFEEMDDQTVEFEEFKYYSLL
ncbi:uncharacterized protein LOC123549301 [Mercenaria mercenaria]|uniref:uncharacterized protein LOC123549301 n=1 Tax=Mercenaria mercenaria TaxID=6596 RepID=UPI00234F3FB5|nr:uncharacterized protein LOC123549301 [Mercenaria mercenaria]